MTMQDGQLFDPGEYGTTVKMKRRLSQQTVVRVQFPWAVLRRLRSAPVAHRIKIDDDTAELGSMLAECGVYGIPMREHDGAQAPACNSCLAKAAS